MVAPLQQRIADLSWFQSVNACVEHFGRREFHLRDFLDTYRPVLASRFPNNRHIDAGVRREMQHLRDADILDFIDNDGSYRCVDLLYASDWEAIDFDAFALHHAPKPNAPPRDLVVMESQTPFVSQGDPLRKERVGRAGELAVISSEKRRLFAKGLNDLAERVEHVADTRGDAAGYDVLSFDERGREKWIEVKTTMGRATTRFHISENQVATSERHPDLYWLYRLYEFQTVASEANMYALNGDLREQLSLNPSSYSAYPL